MVQKEDKMDTTNSSQVNSHLVKNYKYGKWLHEAGF